MANVHETSVSKHRLPELSTALVLRSPFAHARLLRKLLSISYANQSHRSFAPIFQYNDASELLTSICDEVLADDCCGTSPLPDSLLNSPSTYESIVDLLETFLFPLATLSSAQSSKSRILHHLSRSVLFSLILDKECTLRSLTQLDRAIQQIPHARDLASLSMSKMLPTVVDGAASLVSIQIGNQNRRVYFVESSSAMLEAGKMLSECGSPVAFSSLNHALFSRQGVMTYLCISMSCCDVLIDTLSTARSVLGAVLKPLLADQLILKVFHGMQTVRQLGRDFSLAISGGIDVLCIASALGIPLLSISALGVYAESISETGDDSGGYALHDSLLRPTLLIASDPSMSAIRLPQYLEAFVFDCRCLLSLDEAMRKLCTGLRGGQCHAQAVEASKHSIAAEYPLPKFWELGYRKLLSDTRKIVPHSSNISPAQDRVLRELWAWRHSQAVSLDLSEGLLASNATLLFIAYCLPCNEAELVELSLLWPIPRALWLMRHDVISSIAAASDFGPVPKYLSVSRSIDVDAGDSSSDTDSLDIDPVCHIGQSSEGVAPGSPAARQDRLFGRVLATPTSRTPSPRPPGAERIEYSPVPYTTAMAVAGDSVHLVAPAGNPSTAGALNQSLASSPVQLAEDVFRYAGWSTPNPFDGSKGRSSPFSGRVASSSKPNEQDSHGSIEDPQGFGLVTLPDTYEEIFEISNRNRNRGKQGKSTGSTGTKTDDQGGASVMSSIDSLTSMVGILAPPSEHIQLMMEDTSDAPPRAFTEPLFDENIYFSVHLNSTAASVSISLEGNNWAGEAESVEAALDVSMSLGWLSNHSVRAEIKRAHLLDMAVQIDVPSENKGAK